MLQEAAPVDLVAAPGAQRQLEAGERAVGAGQVDREHGEGDRHVEQQQEPPPKGEEPAGDHQQDRAGVQGRDGVREEHVVSVRHCRHPRHCTTRDRPGAR